MLEKIALQLTRLLISKNIITQEDEEIYVYGWSLLISTVGSFIVILLTGTYLKQLFGTILFLLFFCGLRTYAGGYHAQDYGRCFFLTMLFYSIAPLLHFYLPIMYIDWAVTFLLFAAITITWLWAPVDHPNKPLNCLDKQKNQTISRIIVSAQTAIVLLVWVWQPWLKQYLVWASAGMAVTSFTLLYVIYHPYKKGGEKNEII